MCTYSICRVQKGGRKCRENGWGQPCPPNTNIYIFRKLYYNGNTSYRINTDVNRTMPQDFLVWNVWIIQSHVAFIITRPNDFANFFKFADIFALFVDTAVDSDDSSRVLNRTALSQTIFTFSRDHWQDSWDHWQGSRDHWQDSQDHWQDSRDHWQDSRDHWQDSRYHWQDPVMSLLTG